MTIFKREIRKSIQHLILTIDKRLFMKKTLLFLFLTVTFSVCAQSPGCFSGTDTFYYEDKNGDDLLQTYSNSLTENQFKEASPRIVTYLKADSPNFNMFCENPKASNSFGTTYSTRDTDFNKTFVDIESSITIRTHRKTYFCIQLFRKFTEDGFYRKSLLVKNNNKDIASIDLPSSKDIKNFSVNMKKHKKGFILECSYGGGNNLYSRHFYFKGDKDSMYLYKIIGMHSKPNSDKIITEKIYIRPQIDIRNFNIVNYIDNTP